MSIAFPFPARSRKFEDVLFRLRASCNHPDDDDDDDTGPAARTTTLSQPPPSKIRLVRDHLGDEGAMILAGALLGNFVPPDPNQGDAEAGAEERADSSSSPPPPAALSPPGCGVVELNLSRCCIGDAGAHALCVAASACMPSLETLNLSFNAISEAGAASLAGLLSNHESNVGRLYLTSNPVGVGGIRALVEALPRCSSLRDLYLSGCALGDDSAEALGDAVVLSGRAFWDGDGEGPGATALRCLKLHENEFTTRGMARLYASIHDGSDLRSLRESNHRIDLGVMTAAGEGFSGEFFDQKEDHGLVSDLRERGVWSPGMSEKWILREGMMRALDVNRRCDRALVDVDGDCDGTLARGERRRIVRAAAAEKIAGALERTLDPPGGVLPFREGRRDDGDGCVRSGGAGRNEELARYFTGTDRAFFPDILAWTGRHCRRQPTSVMYAILRDTPELFECSRFDGKEDAR